MSRAARTLSAFTALALAAGTAAAHTGHGHADMGFFDGLRHAVGEADHLLMLAFGFGFASLAAPRVLRGLQRLLRGWHERRQARKTAGHDLLR